MVFGEDKNERSDMIVTAWNSSYAKQWLIRSAWVKNRKISPRIEMGTRAEDRGKQEDAGLGWGNGKKPDLVPSVSPHSDSSTVTFLLQDDDISALQFKHSEGWVPVKPVSDALVVNSGKVLEIHLQFPGLEQWGVKKHRA
ncbi:hypothetical protein RJ639_005118 [Escallonia herrerae]|uniref:Isopenicillin N synthase-like Fe(2+) 2OG dioxygenase domain-containing protein n=1 Tax=Escallonia herrerae TaxID=1293975 RepID=A0AA89AY32_9ASTE|nr:hypothetical protein RJ639_005118 [Escallonia herrerae]